MIEAVLFDWDGIVADSAALQVEAEQVTAQIMAEELEVELDISTINWAEFEGWGRTKIAAKLFGPDAKLAEYYRERVVDTTVDIMGPHNLSPSSALPRFLERQKYADWCCHLFQ